MPVDTTEEQIPDITKVSVEETVPQEADSKQMLVGEETEGAEDITDLSKPSQPPSLHVSKGRTLCAMCQFFRYDGVCTLYNARVSPAQTCDSYLLARPSEYNGNQFKGGAKAGARNNHRDRKIVQDAHDLMCSMGANCKTDGYREDEDERQKGAEESPEDTTFQPKTGQKSTIPNYTNNELKAVAKDDKYLTVENHIVLFGGRDLEGRANKNVNKDGSLGEFFSDNVELESGYTKTDNVIVDWEHGKAPQYYNNQEPGRHDPLGKVLWESAQKTPNGIMIKMLLNRQNRFIEEVVEPLIEIGAISTSSEAIPNSVEKSDNGEITKWSLMRNTLTMTPMEPRMLKKIGGNQITALKALASDMPEAQSIINEYEKNNRTKAKAEAEAAAAAILYSM